MEKLIHCLSELEKLKTVERGLHVGHRKESSAEHSWSCMLLADILLDALKEQLDRQKVMEYLLYHDLVEVYAGDAKFNDPATMKVKEKKEHEAQIKIQELLPKPQRYQKIIEEYEQRLTLEAKFAKAIDCLDSCIRNLNDEQATAADGFTERLIRDKYEPHVSKFSLTHQLFEKLMEKLVALDKV
jgi:putative hydrolase of HD superfamily